MSERRNRLDWRVTLGITIVADLVLFPMILTALEAPILSRGVSFLTAYAVSQMLRATTGLGKSPGAILQVPGLWPLLAITGLINFGLFGILNARAPEIQPILHLLLAWAAALLFIAFGVYRIKRFR
ncbi:hypothetical protein DMY87_05770 [Rhizobium wuzhouense]|uniref:Uncharacterized protein n=1 Tax=Rhizobium wuzhouense TaxID=1986026 RepID=A0ABX5P223_9HYPH|nr:hypothetical protein DMY87_05770 [Rhizobium wuzhouense]